MLSTFQDLAPEETNQVMNHRRLWSAHLNPLSTNLQGILKALAGTKTLNPQLLVLLLLLVLLFVRSRSRAVTRARGPCLLQGKLESNSLETNYPSRRFPSCLSPLFQS